MTIPSLALPTNSGNLANISPPPRSLIGQVISAVPASVLVDLFDPSKRRALGSEIQAGSTPTWYQNLPTDVKNYMAVVKSQISEGALTASPTASNSDSDSRSGSVSNEAMPTATADETATGAASDTNSGGRIQPGAIKVAIAGAIAIMGMMSLL